MLTLLRKLFAIRAARRPQAGRKDGVARTARPQLEALEERQVPTVTYHGGALLDHVKVETYFYGPNWNTDATLLSQRGQLNSYLGYLVSGPYMDMLSNAGYGVGRGTWDYWWNTYRDPTSSLDDSTIRSSLQQDITAGRLQSPDGERLYVVFVQPGTVVTRGNSSSTRDFNGYHDSFQGTDAGGNSVRIYYAVLAYPGNGTGYFSGNGSVIDALTDITSHEVAEAVTNPNYHSSSYGWNDDHLNGKNTAPADGEIGDITEHLSPNWVRLNGYAVTKIAAQNDQPIVPYEGAALNYVAAGYTYGYYDYVYGSHSIDAYYAYIDGYTAYVYAQQAVSTHNATDWYYAWAYANAAETYAYADYASTGAVYAYDAYVNDYYGSVYSSYIYAGEKAN
jgi:hypothetical protein